MKTLLSYIFSPLTFVFLLLILGNALLFSRKHLNIGRILITLSLVGLLFFSSPYVTKSFLNNLEYKYFPISTTDIRKINAIVLLSGGAERKINLPISAQVQRSSVVRLCEAVRLLHLNPKAKLIISGGGQFKNRTYLARSSIIADLAVSLGVPPDKIVCETESKNTYENALFVKKFVGENPFALVTSSLHMPRSMAVFQALGMKPIPAPTDYISSREIPLNSGTMCLSISSNLHDWILKLPNASSLDEFTRGLHEWMKLVYYKIRYFNDTQK